MAKGGEGAQAQASRVTLEGRVLTLEDALRGLRTAIREVDTGKGTGWNAVMAALAVADTVLP
jgi:hypothetical protein